MPIGIEDYERQIQGVRRLTEAHPGLRGPLDPLIAPELLYRFFIEFCSLGVQLTAPVEGWIRRAGIRCREIGMAALGEDLVEHAAHKLGHEHLFVNDTLSLVADCAARYRRDLDPAALLTQRRTPAIQRYIDLHEETLAGPAPFAQIAIEFEIQGLSVSVGPRLIGQFERVMGSDSSSCLRSLREHVALDAGLAALHRERLTRLLEAEPSSIGCLVDAGSRALGAYLDFLGECLSRARASLGTIDPARTPG